MIYLKLGRQLKKNKTKNRKGGTGIRLEYIEPITDAQNRAFQAFSSDKNVLLHGVAGTGKTFISLFLALRDILDQYDDKTTIHLIRSVVPTRDMGFLPGNQKEKSKGQTFSDWLKSKDIEELKRIELSNGGTAESYADLIDAYEKNIDVMPGESLTEYIKRVRAAEAKEGN